MPITGVLVTCREHRASRVRSLITKRPRLEVRNQNGNMLVVVTDTPTLAADREEINWLESLPGVASALVAYTNIEDLAETASAAGENS